VQVWASQILVEGASTNQRLSLTTKLDSEAANDVLDRMCELDRVGVDIIAVRGTRTTCRRQHSPPS
jgi:hypothetical protein